MKLTTQQHISFDLRVSKQHDVMSGMNVAMRIPGTHDCYSGKCFISRNFGVPLITIAKYIMLQKTVYKK